MSSYLDELNIAPSMGLTQVPKVKLAEGHNCGSESHSSHPEDHTGLSEGRTGHSGCRTGRSEGRTGHS